MNPEPAPWYFTETSQWKLCIAGRGDEPEIKVVLTGTYKEISDSLNDNSFLLKYMPEGTLGKIYQQPYRLKRIK